MSAAFKGRREDRRLITGDRMMLAHVYLKKGCIVPRHQHDNEQLTYILSGALRFWIGEDEAQEVIVRELVAEAALALRLESTVEDLLRVVHAHPTMAEAIGEAAHGVHGAPIHS